MAHLHQVVIKQASYLASDICQMLETSLKKAAGFQDWLLLVLAIADS